jgi:5-methylcytosine-specific restriction endonuclease McrA
VDHKQSLSQEGEDKEEKFVIACVFCNNEKGAMTDNQYKNYRKYKNYLHTLENDQLEEK